MPAAWGRGKEVRFRLYAAVASTLARWVQGRRKPMAEKAMGEFMTDVAALPIRVMGIVVHNRRVQSARHGDCRKWGLVLTEERAGAVALPELNELNLEKRANCNWIYWVDGPQAHFFANAEGDAIGFGLKSLNEIHHVIPFPQPQRR
jgi:hypothetical protein